jgi:histidine triad (HIT) family protein
LSQTNYCIFCEIANGRARERETVLYEDDAVIAFLARRPDKLENSVRYAEGHTLVIPKKHFENIFDVDNDSLSAVLKIAKKVALRMKAALQVQGVLIYLSNGEVAGQQIFHLHIHVIPRKEGDGISIRGPVVMVDEIRQKALGENLSI